MKVSGAYVGMTNVNEIELDKIVGLLSTYLRNRIEDGQVKISVVKDGDDPKNDQFCFQFDVDLTVSLTASFEEVAKSCLLRGSTLTTAK